MCIGAARMHAVGQVRYAARDPVAGSASFATMTPFMQRWPIAVTGPQDKALEAALLALHTDFVLRRGGQWADVTECDPACAPGVRLGRRLSASGELSRLVAAGLGPPAVLDWLAQQLEYGMGVPHTTDHRVGAAPWGGDGVGAGGSGGEVTPYANE